MPTTSKPQVALDLPVRLDPSIRNQAQRVHAALREAIVEGRLAPGTKMPSSRALADQLGIGRNAVVAAYEHLVSDGLAEAQHGAGTYVAARLPLPVPDESVPDGSVPGEAVQEGASPATDVGPPPRGPFALGRTHADDTLLRRLGSHVRRRVTLADVADLDYGDPRGSRHLREQIARYLAVSRGVRCDPSCILVVTGTQHGLRLCLDALLDPGAPVWIEDPGYTAAQHTLRAAGVTLVPVPVDGQGLDAAAGQALRPDAKAVYVTPSHQFPTGVTMTMERRVALLDWAQASGAWIFEDDYDSEFRYAGPPLTALAGIGPERVIYIGTFAKLLFPGLRLAYLVAPPGIVDRLAAARAALDRFPSPFMQDAVADLMADGTVSAHLKRVRTRYGKARDMVARTLAEEAGDALRVVSPPQGLHMAAYLPAGAGPEDAVAIRAAANVQARLFSEARLGPDGPEAIVLGFSGHGFEELRDAATRLGQAARLVR